MCEARSPIEVEDLSDYPDAAADAQFEAIQASIGNPVDKATLVAVLAVLEGIATQGRELTIRRRGGVTRFSVSDSDGLALVIESARLLGCFATFIAGPPVGVKSQPISDVPEHQGGE